MLCHCSSKYAQECVEWRRVSLSADVTQEPLDYQKGYSAFCDVLSSAKALGPRIARSNLPILHG